MISIKVQCVCGQKYAFEVELVNGRMPQPVQCPSCGADGTAAANEIIALTLTAPRPILSVNRPATSSSAVIPAQAPKAPVKKSKVALWIGTCAGGVALAAVVAGFIWWKHLPTKNHNAHPAVTAPIHANQGTKQVASTPALPAAVGKKPTVAFPPLDQPLPAGAVDMLDYILQDGGTNNSWTVFDTDVRPDRDPDGTDTPTFVLNKWMNRWAYEVYKVTAHEIQIRYEAQAHDNPNESFWIRRSEENGGEGQAPGAIWLKRIMVPGGPGFFRSGTLDTCVFDPKTGTGTLAKDSCVQSAKSYVSIAWVTNALGEKCLFEGKPVIRRFDEWLPDGGTFEAYDYAYRNGMVGWHWYSRLSTLQPMEGDPMRQILHCEDGYIFVASKGSTTKAPEVWQYDPKTKKKTTSLRVIRFKSHMNPALGEQWYVIYRDTGDEYDLLQKKPGRAAHDFTIPAWTQKPGATIADIPCLYTHMPTLTNRPKGDAFDVSPAASPAKQVQGISPEDRLKQLKDLFDQGLITKEVYDQKRQEILKSL
jgi:hypothetical protein